ncbi:hypothetical protein Fmac_027481 [Flemingia macrophylla]|uniref:Uncharacterized protein n=1 Tax=Flemingia macrophylla TaxID=520843 RepID=A0ABD1LHZ8_9FABA
MEYLTSLLSFAMFLTKFRDITYNTIQRLQPQTLCQNSSKAKLMTIILGFDQQGELANLYELQVDPSNQCENQNLFFCEPLMGVANAVLASVLWYQAKSTDLKSKKSITSFYSLIWKTNWTTQSQLVVLHQAFIAFHEQPDHVHPSMLSSFSNSQSKHQRDQRKKEVTFDTRETLEDRREQWSKRGSENQDCLENGQDFSTRLFLLGGLKNDNGDQAITVVATVRSDDSGEQRNANDSDGKHRWWWQTEKQQSKCMPTTVTPDGPS